MTRDEIHRLALRAAAKVTAGFRRTSAGAAIGLALSAASLGCGSSSADAIGVAPDATTVADTTALDIDAWLDTFVAGNDTTATEDVAAAEDVAAPEDVATAEDTAAPEDTASPEDVATADDAGTPEDVAAADDAPTFADIGDGLVSCVHEDVTDWTCCEAQGWLPVETCTPWGPPAPPAYRGERLA